MPLYHKLGNIPPKRHTIFKKPNGDYYYEQLFGTVGFDGMSSNMYHEHRPTQVKEIKGSYSVKPEIVRANNIQSYRLRGFQVPQTPDFLESRKPMLTNSDCTITLAAPTNKTQDYFYKNTDSDELIFIHKGTGKLRTILGNLDFKYGDYLLIPRGIIYKIDFDTDDNRLFIVESRRPIYTPKRYRNWFGQLLEHSPFCERDIRRPEELETYDEKGEFLVKVRKQDEIFDMIYATHPFMLSDTMDTTIRMRFLFMILNRLQEESTSRHQCIKPLKPMLLWYVHSYLVCTTTIRILFRHHTTIVILILTKCFTMWTVIL